MQQDPKWPLVLALAGFIGFFLLTQWRGEQPATAPPLPEHDRVVISAPLLTALYGGDHFLAANLETIRLSATGIEGGQADIYYLIRAHEVASTLNPCHEDNFYLANALLTWGGAVDEGAKILQRATECRYWDEVPPFFYGFNQFFFNHNTPEAQRSLEVAAKRSSANAASFRGLAIMMEVGQIEEETVALKILRHEREKAEGAKLAAMLDKRIARLEGLAQLREAQRQYEEHMGIPLSHPNELIASGFLDKFPIDPLNRGYEFFDGRFRFKAVKAAGMEIR